MAEAGTDLENFVIGLDVGCLDYLLALSFVEEKVLAEGTFGLELVFGKELFEGGEVINIYSGIRHGRFL